MSAVPIVKDKVILLRGDATETGRRRNGWKVYVALGRLDIVYILVPAT